VERLHAVFNGLMDLMSQNNKKLYWGTILKRFCPILKKMKDEKSAEKICADHRSARQMQLTLDGFMPTASAGLNRYSAQAARSSAKSSAAQA